MAEDAPDLPEEVIRGWAKLRGQNTPITMSAQEIDFLLSTLYALVGAQMRTQGALLATLASDDAGALSSITEAILTAQKAEAGIDLFMAALVNNR